MIADETAISVATSVRGERRPKVAYGQSSTMHEDSIKRADSWKSYAMPARLDSTDVLEDVGTKGFGVSWAFGAADLEESGLGYQDEANVN